MHVEACLETSRDGGSNPPASSLRSLLVSEGRLPRWSISENGLSFKTFRNAPSYDSPSYFVAARPSVLIYSINFR